MTRPGRRGDGGAGREAGSVPFSPRARARRTYRTRRRRLLEIPVEALRERYGDAVEVDEEFFRNARVDLGDHRLEVGFAGKYRMFGALIDTQWVAERGILGAERNEMDYRFDKERFSVRRGVDTGLAEWAADATTRKLASRAELKEIRLLDDGSSRQVQIRPLAGTITAMYFPPLPPYSVPLKQGEARDHIELALHLLHL